MTTEDDRIRQALSTGEPSFTAHSALQQLRPTMQRARLRRRVATGAATLVLFFGGSAGALTLANSRNPPTLRTVNNDETGQSFLPEPTTVPPTTVPPTTQAPDVTLAPPAMLVVPESTTSSVVPEADDAAPAADIGRVPATRTPVPTIAPPTPLAPTPPAPIPPAPTPQAPTPPAAPPAITARAISQTIASNCGDVLVSIENATVRIVSITARPGYESQVSDDGPISIEIVLHGIDNKCELHAELKSGTLDVEVQDSSEDR